MVLQPLDQAKIRYPRNLLHLHPLEFLLRHHHHQRLMVHRYRVKGEIEVSLAKFNSKIFWKIKIGSTESSNWNFFQFLICSLETPGDCIRIGCIANTITPVHLFANSRIRKTTWNTFLLRCNNRIGIGVLQVYCLCQSVVEHKDSIQTASSVSRYFEYCVYCTNVECVLD